MERTFQAASEVLDQAQEFMEEQLESADCSPKFMMQMALILEELFLNVAHYAYPVEGGGPITIDISVTDGILQMILRDSGKPFDPFTEAPPPDLDSNVMDRRIGGLGVHLVKQLTNSYRYDYINGENTVTLTKKI